MRESDKEEIFDKEGMFIYMFGMLGLMVAPWIIGVLGFLFGPIIGAVFGLFLYETLYITMPKLLSGLKGLPKRGIKN